MCYFAVNSTFFSPLEMEKNSIFLVNKNLLHHWNLRSLVGKNRLNKWQHQQWLTPQKVLCYSFLFDAENK